MGIGGFSAVSEKENDIHLVLNKNEVNSCIVYRGTVTYYVANMLAEGVLKSSF